MKYRKIAIVLSLAAVVISDITSINAFIPGQVIRQRTIFSQLSSSQLSSTTQDKQFSFSDRGSEWPTLVSGAPSDEARRTCPRKILLRSKVKSTKDGNDVSVGPLMRDGVSIVVFLRSFG